ncbi:cytokinin dehydrogenase 1, FAD and cytokinin-binding protein [Medicago truncatula]|uniref:Cytokinin dehydrogenase 1, FAD and cytokinin-binding protein n=1 Tax=Medicago truncatula TaxID=3880 RepID=G7III9_MEDTR|nr:cytokinin dehydrogenase 1, FAD and cytokinin-binding protein [Medicago truncatula]
MPNKTTPHKTTNNTRSHLDNESGILSYPLWVFFAGTHWTWVQLSSLPVDFCVNSTGNTFLVDFAKDLGSQVRLYKIPDSATDYTLDLLHAAKGLDEVKAFQAQNHDILQFCNDAGIKIKEYLTRNKTHQEWVEHFGTKCNCLKREKLNLIPKEYCHQGKGFFSRQSARF